MCFSGQTSPKLHLGEQPHFRKNLLKKRALWKHDGKGHHCGWAAILTCLCLFPTAGSQGDRGDKGSTGTGLDGPAGDQGPQGRPLSLYSSSGGGLEIFFKGKALRTWLATAFIILVFRNNE